MEKHKFLINILPFSLLLFELVNILRAGSPDELNIPYVPYVVVNKNKDEFDYDKVQQTIVKYLENRSQRQTYEDEQTTTLYDHLKTSTAYPRIPESKPIDTRSLDLHPQDFHQSFHLQNIAPTTMRYHGPYHYETTSAHNLSSISKSFNPILNKFYSPASDMAMQETKFVPLKESLFSTFKETYPSTYYGLPSKGVDMDAFPYGGNMKCSLRSSRYVYDGDCKSKTPVVETVCADRCIKYEYNKMNKPFFNGSPNSGKFPKSIEIERPVIALACKDGDVKKQKIKLYCKDGTIINNVIRIVNTCICQEHSEKVHATKKTKPKQVPKNMMYRRRSALPKVQIVSRF